MYEETHTVNDPTITKAGAYPGRPELNAANARFRRALARLHKEAVRHDPELLPQLAALVGEATEHLLRLASDAEAAENGSARHRAALKAQTDKTLRTLRRAARQGSPHAVRMLQRMEADGER